MGLDSISPITLQPLDNQLRTHHQVYIHQTHIGTVTEESRLNSNYGGRSLITVKMIRLFLFLTARGNYWCAIRLVKLCTAL